MDKEMITIPKDVYESERKMRFFGANAEDVYKKKYNIFIGISISNKKITSEIASNYLKWAVKNTKEKVAIVIADDLNIVNYELLDNYTNSKARKRAERVGGEFEKLFDGAREKLSEIDRKKINIFRWKEIRENKHYEDVRKFLEEQYSKDQEFKSAVRYFIGKYMRKKGKVISDDEKVDRLASYILGELPTLLEGVKVDGTHYKLCIYPTYFASGMSQFVMDIHAEELEIGKKLKKILKDKAVLVEAWLD
jgi:tRNA-dependent cyclodipeptide synthase